MNKLLHSMMFLRIFFSPDGVNTGGQDGNNPPEGTGSTPPSGTGSGDQKDKTISVEEFTKMQETLKKISSNFDRLNTDHQKTLKELDEEKKKSLTAEQLKAAVEKEKADALAKKEQEVHFGLMKLKSIELLSEKKLGNEYVDFVTGNSEDEIKVKVEKLSKLIVDHVEKAKNELLGTSGHKPDGTPQNGGQKNFPFFTEDQVAKMSQAEIVQNHENIMKSMEFWKK